MGLKQKCPFCEQETLAKRLVAFYVGSTGQVRLWECRECKGAWSKETLKGVGA